MLRQVKVDLNPKKKMRNPFQIQFLSMNVKFYKKKWNLVQPKLLELK